MKDFRAYNKLCVGRHIRQILNYMPYILFHWKGGYNKVLNGNKYFRIQWYLYHNIPLDLPMNNRWGRHCCRVALVIEGCRPGKTGFGAAFRAKLTFLKTGAGVGFNFVAQAERAMVAGLPVLNIAVGNS